MSAWRQEIVAFVVAVGLLLAVMWLNTRRVDMQVKQFDQQQKGSVQ